jgi:hypothetical protein
MTSSLRRVTLGDVIACHYAEGHADAATRAFKQVVEYVLAAGRAWAHARRRLRLILVPLAKNCLDVLPLILRELRFILRLLPQLCCPRMRRILLQTSESRLQRAEPTHLHLRNFALAHSQEVNQVHLVCRRKNATGLF